MIKAVIFDFDGVIADTEHLHFLAFRDVLIKNNLELSEDVYYSEYLAYDDKTFFRKYYDNNSLVLSDESLARLLISKSEVFDSIIEGHIKIYPHVEVFIEMLSANYILAIGSGALKKEITQILSTIALDKHFDTIIAADDVINCKPNPEVYIKVLDTINKARKTPIKADECVVIEDSIYGIQAAKSAGMRCVAITHSYTADKLTEADMVVQTFIDNSLITYFNLM